MQVRDKREREIKEKKKITEAARIFGHPNTHTHTHTKICITSK